MDGHFLIGIGGVQMGDLRGIGQVFVCWKENGCPAHEWSGIKPKGLGEGVFSCMRYLAVILPMWDIQ